MHNPVSLISAGTERMLVDFGRASLVARRQQPDFRLRQVLAKVQTDGTATTLGGGAPKAGTPALPLGYCNVGVVTEVGSGAEAFTVGDRVVSSARTPTW